MSDPKWDDCFVPVMSKAIRALGGLISGDLFDKLLESKFITTDQYDQLRRLSRDPRSSQSEVARELFMILKRRPTPSFDNFCSIMKEYDKDGALLCYLMTTPVSPLQTLIQRAPSPCRSDVTAFHHVSPSDDEETVFVDVAEDLKELYEGRCGRFRTALRNYLREALPKRVRIVESFPPTDTLTELQNTLKVAEKVKISILLPNIDRKRFKQKENDFVTYIARLMKVRKCDIELYVEDGSCIITMTVPGGGFINLMDHLGDCGILSVLYKIDAGALISFETFPWAPIGRLTAKVFTSLFDRLQGSDRSTEYKRRVASVRWTLDSFHLPKLDILKLKNSLSSRLIEVERHAVGDTKIQAKQIEEKAQATARGSVELDAAGIAQNSSDGLFVESRGAGWRPKGNDAVFYDARKSLDDLSRIILESRRKIDLSRRWLISTFGRFDGENKRDALNFACFCGYLSSARALIDSGCSVDAQSLSGETPLMAACQNDDIEIIKLLSSEGCNLFLRDNRHFTAFLHACMYAKNLAESFPSVTADLSASDYDGNPRQRFSIESPDWEMANEVAQASGMEDFVIRGGAFLRHVAGRPTKVSPGVFYLVKVLLAMAPFLVRCVDQHRRRQLLWFVRKSGQVDIENLFIDVHSQSPSAIQRKVHLVVAIDIGTTFSSYAMSLSRDKFDIYVMRADDGFGGYVQAKVPTVLLLKPDLTFHSFGQEALAIYLRHLEEDQQKEWHCFERFKMSLHSKQDLSRRTEIPAANGEMFPIGTVFARVLRYFRNQAIEECYSFSELAQLGLALLNEMEWVITVPAIWSDAAKQMMREAAYEAGLASEAQPDRVRISLEPESASLYCKSLQHLENADTADRMVSSVFQSGKRYVLADLGGGKTDIAVHKVLPDRSVKELHCATGGAWGGTYVDKNFVKLLEQIFDKDVIDEYRATHPGDWVDFISMKFETSKRMAAPGSTTYVEVPFTFYTFLQTKNTTIKDCVIAFGNDNVKWHSRGSLVLKYPEVAKLFDPVLTNIADHLKRIFAFVDSIDYLILVGGFATCHLLQLRLKQEFEEAKGIRVIIPRHSSLAVVMGAVLFGHDPDQISARRVRYSYGIECSDPTETLAETTLRRPTARSGASIFDHFPESADSIETVVSPDRDDDTMLRALRPQSPVRPTLVTSRGRGSTSTGGLFESRSPGIQAQRRCFATFVRKNQEVGVNEKVSHFFMPFFSHQTEATITLYQSVHEETRYVTDDGVRQLKGEMKLPMPNSHLGQDRLIEVSMEFGSTEVKVRALEKSTGTTVEQLAKVDFLG